MLGGRSINSGALACASGAQYLREKGKPIGAKKFGYDVSVRPYVSTDSGRRGKNLTGVGKGVPDMYVASRLCSKSTILGATNGVARVKI